MDQDTIQDILGSGSPELEVLKENLALLTDFIMLVETVDKLPEMDRRISEDGLSLYHAISKEEEMTALEALLGSFFGDPVKRAGEALSADLADNLTIGYLGGVKEDQTIFLKKIGQGEMYGALFPWQKKVNVITVHLGLYNPVMADSDYEKLENLITETITQRVSKVVESGLAGQVQGISLPSFLQMSEMEGSTCSLRISSGDRNGMLHLLNGNLIDAETDELKHRDAAYAILGWDNPVIEILKAAGRTQNEIKLPLMHLLMDSMRQKDQVEFEKDASPQKAKAKPSQTKETKSPARKEPAITEMPIETRPQKVEKKAPPTIPGPEGSKTKVEIDSTEITLEKESLDQPSGKAIEETPSQPQGNVPETEDVIDEALIQKDTSRPGKPLRVNKAAGGLKSKKKFPMAMVAGLAILVICVAGFFIYQGMSGDAGTSDYQRLLNKVRKLTDTDSQENLLMEFINTHESGEDTARAEMKLKEILQQNEEINYQKTIDAVNNLPIDQDFEKNARALYIRFLEKYPNTQHKEDIQHAVSEISSLSEDIGFSNLKNLGEKNYARKIDAYKDYLSLYPQGKHRDSVNQMFSQTLGESYMNFKREMAVCEQDAKWDTCLTICDDYLAAFSAYLDTGEIQTIRNRISMEKDYQILQTRVAGVDDEGARRLYLAYMTAYPDSSNNEEIRKNLQRMDLDAMAGRQWASIKKSTHSSSLSSQEKIDRIEKFISRNNTSRYVVEARETLKSLRKDVDKRSINRKQPIKSLSAEENAKKEAEEQYAVLVKRQAEQDRIQREKKKAIVSLDQTKGRFVLTGDSAVKDQRTGLLWSLLDSQRELGTCMDHEAARRYVKDLQYNGYHDWRLPTSAELAGIYKNKPYFPDSGAEWYWTSEIFAKGYSYIVNTVSAKQETVFKKVSKDVEGCGAVRAVRP